MLRLVGSALIAYGLAGVVVLVAVGLSVARPLDDINRLGQALDAQQVAALEALDEATTTIGTTAGSVRNLETSLVEANAATTRAAGLTRGMALTMRGLGQQMQLTILGLQPLAGLAPGFEQSALQLDLLGDDVDAIGSALDANREDALAVADGLDELGESIGRLRSAVADSPDLEMTAASLQPIQLGLLALLGWLLVGALASILAGLGCWVAVRGTRRGSIEPTA